MTRVEDRRELAVAVWRTWGAKGLARRTAYEGAKRTGRLQAAERRWLAGSAGADGALRPVGVIAPASATPPDPDRFVDGAGLRLYGGLTVATPVPPDWHRHPLTGHRFPADVHWSTLSDAAAEAGDIKDPWELSRLGWLLPMLRHWAATGDDVVAEQIWLVVEDWHRRNPPYLGPNWMCAQETSLRTLTVMFLADALAASTATTPARRALVSAMVRDAVGRVTPTLGYALSQRNNHASSEAGFLWTASVLAPWLPDAARLRRRAADALSEVVADQFAADGSYSQHSPTYQRVALHVLLWCLAVERATGEPAPPGVADAVARSVPHIRSLIAPGSTGLVPNLGGNDGALVFDLAPTPIGDLRPVLAHAAAATAQPSGLGRGPWDEEAAWFDLTAVDGTPGPAPQAITTHALTRGEAHAVLRAGPLRHRPAHADQLHVDVWLAGMPVAVDPGSYRYTALPPWGNALAGDDVHNLPTVAGHAQAARAGRFFWRRWSEASVELVTDSPDHVAVLAALELPEVTTLRRSVLVGHGLVVVVDRTDAADAQVRWNLPAGTRAVAVDGLTTVHGPAWEVRLDHGGVAALPVATESDPTSGWHAPTYGVREPLAPVLVPLTPARPVISAFAVTSQAGRLAEVVAAAARLAGELGDAATAARVLSAGA